MRLRNFAAVLAMVSCIASPSFGFTKDEALQKSEGLSAQQMEASWHNFTSGYALSMRGDPVEAAFQIRDGLRINPAEAAMHELAASLFELGGADGHALWHWRAVWSLATPKSELEARAVLAMDRLGVRLAKNDRLVNCTVLGKLESAWSSQCDTPQATNRAAGAFSAESEYARVQSYPGKQRPANEVATIFAMDAGNWGATYICKIDGAAIGGGRPATVVYVLPGQRTLGWCQSGPGLNAQGETQVRVRAGKLYQINASSLGNGRYRDTFIEMPTRTLTWRGIAPGKSQLPGIDSEVPYGQN